MKTCKILINDEVNCKISDLSPEVRRALYKKFSFDVPGARFLPAVKLGRWDGKTSFFSLAGSTYINLLPDILPILDAQGYDIELIDTREYNTVFNFENVTEETFKHKLWPVGHPVAGQEVVLRDYQIDVINKFLENPQALQSVATGAGKTLITAALSSSIENYGRSIVIVPNVSLVTQTEADYINLGLDVGVFYGGRKEFGKTHTICTWQSLNALMKSTKEGKADITIQEFLEDVICVIVDEVHGAKAAALKDMLSGIMSKIPLRWGLTGTIPKDKGDALTLKITLGEVINHLAASDLQDMGVLSNCDIKIMQYQDHADFKDYQTELKFLVSDDKRLKHISRTIHKIRLSGNTLVLVDRIEAGDTLKSLLIDMAIDDGLEPDVVFVSGGTKMTERKEHYDDVTTATNKIVIATYALAAVGINLPRLFNVVLLEPGKSFVRVIQSIGRGIRKAEGKDHVMIYDITSSCKFSKRHLTERKKFYKESLYPFSIDKITYK